MTEANSLSLDRRGFFISFEGTEGSGKSTQLRLLTARLRAEGLTVVANQEPGGTAIGTAIRRILLDPANSEMAPTTELLLMFASRAQAAHERIVPALQAGAVVVTDRWTDSTLAYQGAGRDLGFEKILKLHTLALGSLFPDLTICTVLDVEAGLERAHERNRKRNGTGINEERLDRQGLDFHRRVFEGYSAIAEREPERFRMIDAKGSEDTVADRIWTEIEPRLRQWSEGKKTAR
jgi:dTMP kinase